MIIAQGSAVFFKENNPPAWYSIISHRDYPAMLPEQGEPYVP